MSRREIARLERLRKTVLCGDSAYQLVTSRSNVRYLSGFTGTDAWLLVGKETVWLITDFRYREQSAEQTAGTGIDCVIREKGYAEALAALIPEGGTVGMEGHSLTVSQWERLKAQLPNREWINTGEGMIALRAVKDSDETAAITASLRITESAVEALLDEIRPGMSEAEVALRFEMIARRMGADALAFETIVASGPRGALPHGVASERVLQSGELIVLDCGVVKDGYCSDITRMISLGEPADPEAPVVLEVVERAVAAAVEQIAVGMTGREADAVGRRVIEEGGYGAFFGHGLGHGVGLEIHERPQLGSASDEKLEEGAVFTIEPGIYLPGRFGVRLEEMAVLAKDGVKILNSMPRGLCVV